MEPTVELTSETEGNFLTPVTEQFTKEPFNLDELISLSNYKAGLIKQMQDGIVVVQSEKDEVDAKIEKARASGAKTTAEIEAEKPLVQVVEEPVLPPLPVEELPTTSIDGQVL